METSYNKHFHSLLLPPHTTATGSPKQMDSVQIREPEPVITVDEVSQAAWSCDGSGGFTFTFHKKLSVAVNWESRLRHDHGVLQKWKIAERH
ncbi:hypothetical protein OIU79_011404 [Salix purpurea]|uniref:Uncharacterized protein n=1 Tax=Salix purpurea TaxID=77065 RepID=A0A9Q0Q178_SALPP|nr:hypothetical protein OIU79_011404 [Salix purpurea]